MMVRRNGAEAKRPITVSVGTTSVIGRLALVSCEAWRDETDSVYQDVTTIESVPYPIVDSLAVRLIRANTRSRISN